MYRDLRRVHRSSRLYHKRWFVEEDKRITAMQNNVPKTKEKTNAEYAIAVAAQEEWSPMHGLKTVKQISIVEKHQGAEVGRYLCLYRDVGYTGQDRTEIYPEHSCTVTTYLYRQLTPSAIRLRIAI